jgi:steroid delta-isomerase-like uncharacterized protein
MNGDNTYPSSLPTIEKYIKALVEADTLTMQAMRTSDFILDWVHSDAYENQPLDVEQTNQFWPAWFKGFSEVDYEVTRTVAAESVVVIQWTFTGTHDGPLGPPVFSPPLKPTGRTIRLRGVSIYNIENLLISRETMYIDLATLWVELGIQE